MVKNMLPSKQKAIVPNSGLSVSWGLYQIKFSRDLYGKLCCLLFYETSRCQTTTTTTTATLAITTTTAAASATNLTNTTTTSTPTNTSIDCGVTGFSDKFVLVDASSHDIIDVEAEEIANVIASGNEGILSSICSMTCARKNCVGFSSNVQDDYSCKLYSKVVFAQRDLNNSNLELNGKLYIK